MEFSSLFKSYALEPEKFWPETHLRNAKKVRAFVDKGRALRAEGRREYVQNIVRLACLRYSFESKHLYLVNAGSSGSHWIEAMLGMLPGFYNGGEVYFSKHLTKPLGSMNEKEASMFLDAVYLLHSGAIHADSLTAVVSNSAHLADHEKISSYSKSKVAVLLLRDPVEVVISRTFRKDEYRSDVAPSLTEKEYLERNCVYVERFYEKLDFDSFDMVVKYEEFLQSPRLNLAKVVELLGLRVCESDIDSAVLKTSKEKVRESINSGKGAVTNIYLGDKKEYGWARDYVRERLSGTIVRSGFS